MKNRLVTLGACLAIAVALVAARGVAGQEMQSSTTKEVAVTGCLVQGSGPSVFILENARANPRDDAEKAWNYLLVSNTASISFRDYLNHEVTVNGKAEKKMYQPPPSGEKVKESDLPKLTATRITEVATTCSQQF